jgi:hypothetical protein
MGLRLPKTFLLEFPCSRFASSLILQGSKDIQNQISIGPQGLVNMGEDFLTIGIGQSAVITIDEYSHVEWISERQIKIVMVTVSDLQSCLDALSRA